MINNRKSPIQDDYREVSRRKELNLTATLDAKAAYSDADFVVIAALRTTTVTRSISTHLRLRGCDQAGHGVQSGCNYGHQIHYSGWLHRKRA